MLSLEESSLLFRFLSFYSSAYILPFQVDRRRGKFEKFSGRKFKLWLCIYCVSLFLHAQELCRFLSHLVLRPDQVVLFHLPAQYDGLILPLMFHPAIILIYCFNGELLVKVFNELFDSSSCPEDESKVRRSFRQLSVQELLVFGIEIIVCGAAIVYGVMVLFLNDMAHLLINIQGLQFLKSSTIPIILTTALEMWSVSMWIFNGGFLLSCNCFVLLKVDSDVTKLSQDIRYVLSA